MIMVFFAPIFAVFPIRQVWRTIAWSQSCNDWEITAVLTGVTWNKFYRSLPLVGTAIVNVGATSYTMRLRRNDYSKWFEFYVTDTANLTPPLFYITYNASDYTYTAANVTGPYRKRPTLSFPALNLEVRDPSIPFTRSNDDCYPPSADLIHRNGAEIQRVLSTVMLEPGNCTALKVCGMQDSNGWFQIGLGVVMIEQYMASVHCTASNVVVEVEDPF